MKKVEEMTPQEHLERAEVLIQTVDAKFDENGNSTVLWQMSPPALDLAAAHLELAMVKKEFNA